MTIRGGHRGKQHHDAGSERRVTISLPAATFTLVDFGLKLRCSFSNLKLCSKRTSFSFLATISFAIRVKKSSADTFSISVCCRRFRLGVVTVKDARVSSSILAMLSRRRRALFSIRFSKLLSLNFFGGWY
ncbi:hypothetical protein ACHAWU_009284 [Discostella pseudostelligera]|uniref:Uncharacterized protein n=1 Tax=Discostella pseudostelligera TaxID=259834 RepID=A0ABD3M271_9STRA